jgi:hypothetical protein
MSRTTATPAGHKQTTQSTWTADASNMSTAKDWFKAVLKIQHLVMTQAQEDRRRALEDRRADRASIPCGSPSQRWPF